MGRPFQPPSLRPSRTRTGSMWSWSICSWGTSASTCARGISPSRRDTVAGIAAQVMVALGGLHAKGMVYRGLKPENVLVTEEGHIKLTDYGFSKVLEDGGEVVEGVAGTVEYLAPESFGGSWGVKSDVWSLGMLIYELRFRETLLELGDRRMSGVTKDGVFPLSRRGIVDRVNAKIGCMSNSFRNLLLRIFELNPSTRITLEQIKNHQFFQGIEWNSIQQRQNQPPLSEMRGRRELMKFRDPSSQKATRSSLASGQTLNYHVNLWEFRVQQ